MFSTNLANVTETVKERLDSAAQLLKAYNQELQESLQTIAARQQEQLEAGKKRAEELINNVEALAMVQRTMELYSKFQELTTEWQTMVQDYLSRLLKLLGVDSVPGLGLKPAASGSTASKSTSAKPKAVKKAVKKAAKKTVKKAAKKTAKKAAKKTAKKAAKKTAKKTVKTGGKR